MAVKRKSSPPPPRSPSFSSDEDTSSEEEQDVVQSSPPLAQTPKRTKADDDKSDSDSESESESESDPEPPKANLNFPLKPSKSESSSDEEDEEVEEESEGTEKLKSPVEESESKPDNKKLKVSGLDQSPSKKSASAFLRIWSQEDEMALLRALSEYHATKGQLPPAKDYAALLSTISGSIGFPVTEKQLGNKIRRLRDVYDKKIKKGTDVNISNPHEKAVFEMCAKLFEGSSKASKKEVKLEVNGGAVNGGTANGHVSGLVADGGVANGDVMARPYFYLGGLIDDLIEGQQCTGLLLTVDKVIAQIGESRAKDLEARIKMFRIGALKLLAREDRLKAELFDILADEIEDD